MYVESWNWVQQNICLSTELTAAGYKSVNKVTMFLHSQFFDMRDKSIRNTETPPTLTLAEQFGSES